MAQDQKSLVSIQEIQKEHYEGENQEFNKKQYKPSFADQEISRKHKILLGSQKRRPPAQTSVKVRENYQEFDHWTYAWYGLVSKQYKY